jgi:hypothetical protein
VRQRLELRAAPRAASSSRTLRFVSALAVALACLWAGGPADAPEASAASDTCTGWPSNSAPPEAIRVLRTTGSAAGTVQVVPFRQYVGIVIAAEWGASTPTEALRVGAVAVKQYAWYWTIVWRG